MATFMKWAMLVVTLAFAVFTVWAWTMYFVDESSGLDSVRGITSLISLPISVTIMALSTFSVWRA